MNPPIDALPRIRRGMLSSFRAILLKFDPTLRTALRSWQNRFVIHVLDQHELPYTFPTDPELESWQARAIVGEQVVAQMIESKGTKG